MKIAVLYYGEIGLNKSIIDNHNRFLYNYDYDVYFSLSNKTHLGSGWKEWENSELYDYLLTEFKNIKGIQISHTPCVIQEDSWEDYIVKNKMNLSYFDFNNGILAYDSSNFSELPNIILSKTDVKNLKKNLKDVNPIFYPKDLKDINKIPFTHKETDIRKKYLGFKMIEKVIVEENNKTRYDLILMCNVNQPLPKIFLEKIVASFALENSIYSFPTSYSYLNINFAMGNFKNMKTYSELWLNLRKYQYFNVQELKNLLTIKTDNPYMLENLHYLHILKNGINMIHLSNLDINNLNSYYNSFNYKNENSSNE